MTDQHTLEQKVRSMTGEELALTIPCNERVRLSLEDMQKLQIRSDGTSALPALADSIVVQIHCDGKDFTFYRIAKSNVPDMGDVKVMQPAELSALKIQSNGLSTRPDLQDSSFKVVSEDDGTALVSREPILHTVVSRDDLQAGVTSDIPAGQRVFLKHSEVSKLRIKSDGTSDVPELRDSIFVGVQTEEAGCFLYRFDKTDVPGIGETRLMKVMELTALKIMQNGESVRADLKDSRFVIKPHSDFTYFVSRIAKGRP